MFFTAYPGKPGKLPWYKTYGFNTEQEFEQWWAKYGAKLKLKFPQLPASQYASYEEYVKKQLLDSAKRGFQSPSRCLLGKSLKIKTADGKTWTFDTADFDLYNRSRCRGLLGKYTLPGTIFTYRNTPDGGPADDLYALCWLATSPLIVSIEASDEAIRMPIEPLEKSADEAIKLGQRNIVSGLAFPHFWLWIMSGRIPLTLTAISRDFPVAQHPPVVPPPYPITPGTLQSPPTTEGTTTGSTTTGGTSTGGTTTTAAIKSALPYVAIGAGVLLLLWAMKK
jgi:hypothetical protein